MPVETFTIHEASAALYAEGSDGEATGEALYVGECMSGITLEMDFERVRREQSGRAHARHHAADEAHSIAWERWFTAREDDGELVTPFLDRFGRYVLVLVLFSEAAQRWVKFIYYGVTVAKDPVAVTDDVLTNNKNLMAERREAITGLASRPDLTAVLVGTLLWISGGVGTVAYTYEFDTETWTSTGAVSEMLLEVDDTTDFLLAVNGELALWVDSGDTRCGELRAVGDLAARNDDLDRVEFRRGSQVYFAIEDDAPFLLLVRNLIEQGTRPTGGADVVLRESGGDWCASLLPGSLRAINLVED